MGMLTFLFDHEYLIVDLLTKQHRVKIVEQRLEVLRPIAERYDNRDAMPSQAVARTTSATRLHLGERLFDHPQLRGCLANGQWTNCNTIQRVTSASCLREATLTEIRRNERASRHQRAVCRISDQRFLRTSNDVAVSSGEVGFQLGRVGIVSGAPKQGRRGGIVVTEYARHRYGPVYDKPTRVMPVATIRVPETKATSRSSLRSFISRQF